MAILPTPPAPIGAGDDVPTLLSHLAEQRAKLAAVPGYNMPALREESAVLLTLVEAILRHHEGRLSRAGL